MSWRDACALEEIVEPGEYKEQRKRSATREANSARKRNMATAMASAGGGETSAVSEGGSGAAGSAVAASDTSQKSEEGAPNQPPADGETDAGPFTASEGLSDRDASRVKTSIPWVKRFTPGHPLSHCQVGDAVLTSRIHCNSRDLEKSTKKPSGLQNTSLAKRLRVPSARSTEPRRVPEVLRGVTQGQSTRHFKPF